MQNFNSTQPQQPQYGQNYIGGQQKRLPQNATNSKNIKTMMNQMKNRKIKQSSNSATGTQMPNNGRSASSGQPSSGQLHTNIGNIVQGNLTGMNQPSNNFTNQKNIVNHNSKNSFQTAHQALGNTQTFNSMNISMGQPGSNKNAIQAPGGRQGSGRQSSKKNPAHNIGYQSLQANANGNSNPIMNPGPQQIAGSGSRSKSVHQYNGSNGQNTNIQTNQQQKNRQFLNSLNLNQSSNPLMNESMQAQSQNAYNTQKPQMNQPAQKGKRSNSDNYNNRKQQGNQPIGSKIGDSSTNNSSKQKMVALTNKLNSIYSSNQNVSQYLTQQNQATSSINNNIGSLVGMQNMTQHTRGSAVGSGSQIPQVMFNSNKVPQYNQNIQRFNSDGIDEHSKYNNIQNNQYQTGYNPQKQGPQGGKIAQINNTKSNSMTNMPSQKGVSAGQNKQIINKNQSNIQNYGEPHQNQGRSHSTQMNNQIQENSKDKNFNKSHGRLPSTENPAAIIHQNMILNKGNNLHGGQNSQQILQTGSNQMGVMPPNMTSGNRRGISPKRSAGQMAASANIASSGQKIAQGQRAKSSGQKQGSQSNYNMPNHIPNSQIQPFGIATNEIFYNHASSAAPASGVVNSQNQIPTKHTRNQAAADVIQAANSMPTHMNGKIPIRTGSKKNGPSSSIMNQNNIMQFNSNPNYNKQPQGRNQMPLNNNLGMNNSLPVGSNNFNMSQATNPSGLHKRNTNPVEGDVKKEDLEQRAEKKRTPSAGKRVPSAKRSASGKSDSARKQQMVKDLEAAKPIQPQLKPNAGGNNMRRSRNDKVMANEQIHNGEINPNSAGQSTSSLHKQEQYQKKFLAGDNKINIKNKDDHIQNVNPIHQAGHNNRSTSLNNNNLPSANDKAAEKKPTPVRKVNKARAASEGPAGPPPDTQGQDSSPSTGNQGLSGRNLYFQQIRNEITLSETNKFKSLPDYQNAKFSNKRNGLVSGYGANTNQGIVRNYNEDRVAIILNIMKPKSKVFDSNLWPKCSFFGIYDGHGGAVCADFLRDYLHQFIIKDDHFPQNPIQALRNGFREAERLFMEFAESQEKEAGEIDRSGSCAVVILIIDDMCYCANTGDSRAIMSADGGEKLFLLSTDHKPTDEVEMKRIIENGGRIYQNSQIIQTNPALGEAGKQVVYGPHRVFPGRLSVSRTVGDIEAKLEKYEGNQNVVIADPDVTAFEIKDNHDFIVIGCDGVFDKLSSKDAIHIGWQKVLMEANKSGIKKIDLEQVHNNCGHCVDGILRTSALRRTVDNVTCVVVSFDGFQKQLQKFIDNNLDGTTVDVIEEIQLEPIPEYLSNQRVDKNKRKADNSMLLLDENEEKDVPNQKELAKGKKAEVLLSEIAEEDDVSSISESIRNPYGFNGGQNRQGSKNGSSFGPGGKSSVTSVKSVQSTSKLSQSHHNPQQSFSNGADIIEKKRRSEMVLPISTINSNKQQNDAKASISSGSIMSHEVNIEDPYQKHGQQVPAKKNLNNQYGSQDLSQSLKDKNMQSLDSQISDFQSNPNGPDSQFKGMQPPRVIGQNSPGNNQSVVTRPNRPGSRKRPSQTRNSLGQYQNDNLASEEPQIELNDIKAQQAPISRGQKLQSSLYGNN